MNDEHLGGSRSFTNFDESVSFMGHQMRSDMLDDSFKNVKFVQDQSEQLAKLRIANFNLSLLCHKYEEVFKRGPIENAGLRIFDLEQENTKIRGQLGLASRMLSSLRDENEGLKKANEELTAKLESNASEWRKKYDSLFVDFQELKTSERRAESRCEVIENESSRLENVKNAEVLTLQQKLISADSKIALLETELAELRSKGNISFDRYSGSLVEDKENVDLSALLDPLPSPHRMSQGSLLRRYSAAQESLKSLKSNCYSLSSDLSACRQELAVSDRKFRLISEQFEEEKAAHLRDLEQRDELERSLHDRIAGLLRDCTDKDELNDELTGELKQMKEFDARIKEEHMRQLNKLHALLEDRERALLEMCVPDAPQAPAEESDVIAEVTQYHHDQDSSIFNSTVEVATRGEKTQEPQQTTDATSIEMTKLQHEVALLRSKLVAQVKANTRLKAAFNALSESNPPTSRTAVVVTAANNSHANLSMSVNPCILEEAGNTSQGNESFVSLLNSNKVSQTLDKTLNELKSALSRVEAELSNSLLEVSQVGEESKREDGVGVHDTTSASGVKPDRLRDVYSLIKGLVDQFDNLRTFRKSFHDSVNRSVLANSLCLETSTRYAVPGTGQQTSFTESVKGDNVERVVLEASARKHDHTEPSEKSFAERDNDESEEVMSVSQLSHNNNTTFHLLREQLNDNTMEDLSTANSLSFATSQRSHALDVTSLEMHSRNIFDRVALAVASVQDALDAWSLDAATKLLAAINANADDTHQPAVSSHDVSVDAGAGANNLPPLDALLDIVTRFAELLSKTRCMELLESPAFSEWCDLVHRWFELFIDCLQRRNVASNLAEISSQLKALEQQFNEEFASITAATHQNAALQTSDNTEAPSISLCENRQLTSTVKKLKADLELNIRELTDKAAPVATLESKVQELMTQLQESGSTSRIKEARVKELEAEIPQLEAKIRDLELNAQTKERRVVELEAELLQLETKLQTLEAQLADAHKMAEVRESKVKDLETEVADSRAKLQDIEMQLTEAHLETQNREMRAQELETEVAESQTKVQNAEARLAEALSDTRTKEIRVQELDTAVLDLREQLAVTETRLSQKEARVVELKAAANDLRGIYDDLERQLCQATKDVDDWKAKSERLEDLLAESIERETGASLKLGSALDEVDNLKKQKLALEGQLRQMLEEHKVNLQSAHDKYKALLEAAESKCAEMAEQVELFQTERDNLREDLAACREEKLMLQSDFTMARIVSANAQMHLGALLDDAPADAGAEDLEAIRQKALKYPHLKALAFSLKAKLERRSTSLHDANQENVRLKTIVGDNERRVQEFIQELERLRQQILVKNKVIKKLESVVREANFECPVSSRDEISSPEVRRVDASTDFSSLGLLNLEATSYLNNGGMSEHFHGVNSLVENIDATVREISVCVEAVAAEYGGGGGDGGARHHNDTSASLADQMSGFSTDTPTSLTVSFADRPTPTQYPHAAAVAASRSANANAIVPERLNHLVNKLSAFCSAITHEVQAFVNTVQNSAAIACECNSEDHMRARRLVRRSIEALGNLSSLHPANMLISHVLESLNEVLELLHRQNSFSWSPNVSNGSRSESAPFSFHQQQLGETAATASQLPPQQADPSSSCSCSCRRRCSRMAASVQELTNILNCTASVLTRRTFSREVAGDMEQVQEEEEDVMAEGDVTSADSLDSRSLN